MATTVLGLKTFTASDPVDYNEINDNYIKIDNGVKTALQGRAAQNLLDNSYWKVKSWIVNQRGATSYTLNGYTIDRWRTYHADNTVTVNSGNLSFTNTIYQNLIWIDASKTYTLAVCDPLGNITMMTSTPESGAWKNNLRLSSESGGIVRVAIAQERSPLVWAALYEGSYTADTLPAYQPKGYAAELAACLWDFERLGASFSDVLGNTVFAKAGAKSVIISIKYSPKRIKNPTITFSNASEYRLLLRDEVNASVYGATPVSSIDQISSQSPFACFRVNLTYALDRDSWLTLQRDDNTDVAFIDVNADL